MRNLQMATCWSVVFCISYLILTVTGSNSKINCCANTDQDVCQRLYPTDCQDVRETQSGCSGIYTIYVGRHKQPVEVFCDMESHTSWTVFQRRVDGRHDFYLDWSSYEDGFGNLNEEYWLGNKYLHLLASQRNYTLRIELENFEGQSRYADYSVFNVESRVHKYRLTIGGYSGNAGDAMLYSSGQYFSTKDEDNDKNRLNCAAKNRGAWWYNSCHHANLNGQYLEGENNKRYEWLTWGPWMGYRYSLKFTEMKLARN